MRVETRSAFILLATLALGIALGVVSGGRWRQLHEVEAEELRRLAGFVQRLNEIIQPREDQAAAVRRELDSTARRNQQIIAQAQQALRAELAAMRIRLAPVLDEAQRARLADESNFGNPLRPPPLRGRRPGEGGRRRLPPPRERPNAPLDR